MVTPRAKYPAIGLVAATGWSVNPQTTDHSPSHPSGIPRLINTCLITDDVNQLVQFYEPILALKAERSGNDYAEFHTGTGVLAIFSAAAQQRYIPGSTQAAKNKRVILEFRVADVDKEYIRLRSNVKTWVKPPSTPPWGPVPFTSVTQTEILSIFMPPKLSNE